MPYFVVENFNAGLDVRRSKETALAGSLRVLRNAVINEGGEIVKRRAFTRQAALTAYGQDAAFKGRISGPHPVPGYPSRAMVRHRGATLPSSGFTAGAGSLAAYLDVGSGFQALRFWVMKSAAPLTSLGALFHAVTATEFAAKAYVVEKQVTAPDADAEIDHVSITYTNDEPTAETVVAANDGRPAQISLSSVSYVASGGQLFGSALNDPEDMSGTGSGSLYFSSNGRPIGQALALGDYFGQVAVFGRRGVQFYQPDPDFTRVQYLRTVTAPLFGPRSVTGYGDGDLMFLSRNGIRSLQARDSSNLAAVSDVGSPIDALVRDLLRYDADEAEPLFSSASPEFPLADFFDLAKGIVYPRTGEFWLFLRDQVLVLSRHPAAKVQAWSTFDLPPVDAANISARNGEAKSRWCADACEIADTIAFRNFADEFYIYGGDTGDDYDDSFCEVVTPFFDLGRPGDSKTFTGIDLVCEGTWKVQVCTTQVSDDREIPWQTIGEITNSTRYRARIPFHSSGVHIAVRLTTSSAQAAKVAQMTLHYNGGHSK